jgi:ferritin-like metal-binding protein YciE
VNRSMSASEERVVQYLSETGAHIERVTTRLEALDQGSNPLMAVVGFWESMIGQVMALSKTPFDLLHGSGGEGKVLKNAKDACATEALEIATYTAIERLASSVGDEETAKLATSILADQQKMLQRLLREIPKLTDAVVGADVKGQTVPRHHHHRRRRRRPGGRRGDPESRPQDERCYAAYGASGSQDSRRRAGRGAEQRSCRLRR